MLDLASREWVEQRMVQGVEVEVEGERWVADLAGDEDGDDEKAQGKGKMRDWEEGIGSERMGEWRRRRWVRTVRRKIVGDNSPTSTAAS